MYSVDVDYCGRQEIKQRGSCAACPILLWSLACSLLEDAYEVGWVVESNLVGNLFAWRILCDEHEDGAAQPHLLPQGHAVVSFHVIDKSCGVVVRLRVALRQHGLRMICAHASEKCGIDVVGFHLGGKIVMLKEVSLAFESLVDMKIVMAENAAALV